MDYSALNLNSVLGTGDEPPSEDTLKEQFIAVETSKPPEYNNLKLSKVVVDSIQQNQEKLTYEHSLVTNGGIFYAAPGEVAGVYAFSPFTQDPFRQSLGSIPILAKSGTISLARTTKSGYKWGLGPSDAPRAIIETNKKYLLPKNYHNSFITNFEITEKTRQADDNVPIYNFNDINQIKIYYGGGAGEESGHTGGTKGSIGGDSNQAQQKMKLNFLSLFFGVTQKMEGYTYTVTESNLSGILIFLSQASSLAYDAVLCGEYNNHLEALNPNLAVGDPTKIIGTDEEGNDIYEVAMSDWDGSSDQAAKVISSISKEVLTNIENNNYYDHTFKMDTAISEETVPLFGEELGQNTAIADIKPNYNFFIKKYENAKIPEVATYNVYNKPKAFANKLHLVGLKDINMFEYAKYGSAVTKGCIDLAQLANSNNPRKNNIIVFDSESTILNNRADDLKGQVPFYNTVEFKADSNRAVSTMMRKHGIMDDFIKTLISYVYGSDPAIQAGIATPADKSMNLLGLAYSGILIANETQSVVSRLKDPASIDFFPKEEESYTNFLQNYQYDFDRWLEYYIAGIKSESDSGVLQLSNQPLINKLATFLVDENSGMQDLENQTKFSKTINMLMFLPKFKSFVEEKARTFEGMMGKTFCYSETLFYRVEKTDQDGNVVQNIFITKPEVSDVVKYIDSQVQYGKIYNYKIIANQLVIGSEYQYKFATNSPDIALLAKKDKSGPYQPYAGASIYTDGATESQFSMYSKIKDIGGGATVPVDAKLSIFTSIMKPDVRIIEVPYHQESDVIVLDSPPMSPVVNFYPIHNKKNDMILSFETQTGNIEQEPISILDEDDAYFALERVQQKRGLKYPLVGEGSGNNSTTQVYVQPRLRFKSDDFSSEYQVFRITGTKPLFYSDFKDNLHQILNVNQRTSFIDKVATNVKYYYTFRSKDEHGNISNPTPVYEFEMVENSGVAYPVISIVDLGSHEEKIYDMSKPMFRYLQIDAAAIQSYLNEDKSGIDGKTAVNETTSPVLGLTETSLWNQKRFKIRVRSKNSGKMVDLNIAFKTRHTKPETIDLCD
tara:strand:- start:3341 stop:6532 length:3192 start_codon:yes stop_codon:yes gene_type:complete